MMNHMTPLFFSFLFFFGLLTFMPVASGVVSAPPELATALTASTDQQASTLLLNQIKTIQDGNKPAAQKAADIAVFIAQAIDALGNRSQAVLGRMVGNLTGNALSAVTAAAVIVTGTKSPAVVKQMLSGLSGESPKQALIKAAAEKPASILSTATIKRISPPLVFRDKTGRIIIVHPTAAKYKGQ